MEIDAVDDAGRHLAVVGEAASRHWRGNGGDTLFHWRWDGAEGWGEDQSYFSRAMWAAPAGTSGRRASRQRVSSMQPAIGPPPFATTATSGRRAT